MKNASEILTHLKYYPEFKKINTNITIERLIKSLPLKLNKGIKFGYIKNQTLFFVLKHPVYKMEFEYNKSLIKSLLKKANIANVNDIKFFVTNVIEKKEEEPKEEDFYKERSYGIFENFCENEDLRKKFEEIRKIIKNS
ncbi:conserved hypothetical protein [Arcobacter nitrofigilis DSM 7299]|uniref:DUF721 domain-containing protein n=1 Tax=Arcobacter nitrofigilis (strain ATCC 33309 / DSM 7299 / CCUG 15893 / LMG 7604 / NCTC 12251 / CI) TaxID=572480 RepID=D5V0A6_ARCNC|nr:hypothetical protein [Arcobacter nitrofigilis]ADG93718.1 conserved hypothetical protein [Arcobacter nitrofigilis DSM 7299]